MQPFGLFDVINRDTSTVGWLFPAIIVAFLLAFLCKLLFPNRGPERPPITWVPLRNLPIDVHAAPPSWDDLVRAQDTAALDREDLPTWSFFVPVGLDIVVLGARALYMHRTAVAPLKFVSGSLRRSWSPSDIAETYAAKVRQQGRDLVAEEVAQLDALRDAVIKKMNTPEPAGTLNPS